MGADCPPEGLGSDGTIKFKVLPPRKLYHPFLPFKSNSKLMFPLSSACAYTMYQGRSTHSDVERCIIRTWVEDEVHKTVDMCCGLVDVFEFWEYELTFREGHQFWMSAQHVNMFLKLKEESSGYPSWDKCDEVKDRFIEDYRRADGIALD